MDFNSNLGQCSDGEGGGDRGQMQTFEEHMDSEVWEAVSPEISPNLPSQQIDQMFLAHLQVCETEAQRAEAGEMSSQARRGLHSNTAVVQNVHYLL